jgi:hypothetical protein
MRARAIAGTIGLAALLLSGCGIQGIDDVLHFQPIGPGNDCGPAQSGLVANWPFDEGSGNTAADASGNGHAGAITNATWTPGVSGSALVFPGDWNSGVDVPDCAAFENLRSFTLETQVRIDGFTWCHGLIMFRGDSRPGLDAFYLSAEPDGTLMFLISDEKTGVTLAVPPPTGRFFHVAATLDDATGAMRLYIDGALVADTTTSIRPIAALSAADGPGLGIGHHAYRDANDYVFKGAIDEAKLYNRALTAQEIAKAAGK